MNGSKIYQTLYDPIAVPLKRKLLFQLQGARKISPITRAPLWHLNVSFGVKGLFTHIIGSQPTNVLIHYVCIESLDRKDVFTWRMWAIAMDMYIRRFTCFTLHSSPPHIACASVRSCAGPSILTRAAAGGYVIIQGKILYRSTQLHS